MIETHVVNALLRAEIKEYPFFKVLSFINGLVAPSFLFCAGFALAITLNRRWNEYLVFGKPLRRYLRRLGFLFIVAYSLHLPFFSWTKVAHLTDVNAWVLFYQSDILQVISLTLLFAVLCAMAVRTEKLFIVAISVSGLIFVFLSPVLRNTDLGNLPVWLQPYLTNRVRSQFPLFPWAAFLLGGILTGFYLLKSAAAGSERPATRRLILAGCAAIAGALIIEFLPVELYPNHSFFNASPEFFFVRFGIIILILSLLWRNERFGGGGGTRWGIILFGQESLIVYVTHLLIVYGYTYKWSFIRLFDHTLDYLQCAGLFLGLAVLMYGLAFVWHRIKTWNGTVAQVIQYAFIAVMVIIFFVKET